ncbi:threonine/serine exporter family protein [Falcatimonas sp. MSJ-15]|uniref:threonine/serine exporter family protein n=1 Tax=Falcatimonas sp. MSJ-15 TaxID=2841515 RepID=UPI001C0FB796|nr:threonine/serine exporter family protein [Falcatimonas sp. MSJ-15]MBU5470071.1 threonine/serine exporter family protein [Falcatimonas sp. MSJ-15]
MENYELLLEVASLAGEIMLKNGAETYRVEDTINRILKMSNLETVASFVVTTGIVASLSGKDAPTLTVVKRVNSRSNHLAKVCDVNEISRKFCSGMITLEEAYAKLNEIDKRTQYPDWLKNICYVVVAVFFTIMLGGRMNDSIISCMNGIILATLLYIGDKIKSTEFLMDVFISMVVAIMTIIYSKILHIAINIDIVIIGSIMALFPGVALTNAIRDTLSGDYASGGARMLEAIVKAIGIGLGVGAGIGFMQLCIGGVLL